ncbi:hypothetical protein PoB_002188000 [Plakobranchus ocellatus]|uniref:Uncharacterized protein n=1 Tax=Plakobranchus ocellatus TaxID=259542 RepID=A0AAV3ZIA1_9GAST|nr:hypothetical protein PoB_002188000 [Plakobranchus ocellatus]
MYNLPTNSNPPPCKFTQVLVGRALYPSLHIPTLHLVNSHQWTRWQSAVSQPTDSNPPPCKIHTNGLGCRALYPSLQIPNLHLVNSQFTPMDSVAERCIPAYRFQTSTL